MNFSLLCQHVWLRNMTLRVLYCFYNAALLLQDDGFQPQTVTLYAGGHVIVEIGAANQVNIGFVVCDEYAEEVHMEDRLAQRSCKPQVSTAASTCLSVHQIAGPPSALAPMLSATTGQVCCSRSISCTQLASDVLHQAALNTRLHLAADVF